MYVCICNALTRTRVEQAIDADGLRRPSEIHAACGCRAQCGSCAKKLLGLVRDLTERRDAAVQGAD